MTTQKQQKQILDDLKDAFDILTNASEVIKSKNDDLNEYELYQIKYFLDKVYLAFEDVDRVVKEKGCRFMGH